MELGCFWTNKYRSIDRWLTEYNTNFDQSVRYADRPESDLSELVVFKGGRWF